MLDTWTREMSEAANLTRKLVWLRFGCVSGPWSSPASSVQFPLVPSHSEGASRTASKLLLTTRKRIEFHPTHRKQTTEVRSTRNKNALFHVVPPRHWSRATDCYSHHGATRNDSRKLATATKHDANNFLAATKSHVLRCLHPGAASLSESRWNSPRVPETGIGEDSVTGAKAATKDRLRRSPAPNGAGSLRSASQ
jgi:hypothetical protein